MLLGGDAKEKLIKCYFFGLTGSQDVQDGQYLTFETDLAVRGS
jgi:hypothetical protein